MNKLVLLAVCGSSLALAACQPAYSTRYPNENNSKVPEYAKEPRYVPDHATSRDHDTMVSHYFDKMDTNNDGYISVGENNIFAKQKFVEADMNDDGYISMNEFTRFKRDMMARMHDGPPAYRDDDYYYNRAHDRWERY